jgi:sporulation protein YlmC with PRC-barrel domain
MPHYGTLRDHKFADIDDVRGADVYGVNDEKLGTIDDVIFDHTSGEIRYAVINAGGWLTSKKFLVPINRISPYGNHDDRFYAELDKERIQMMPEYNEEALKSEAGWSEYEKKYEEHWTTSGDVMHNQETGRIITPAPDQLLQGSSQPLSSEARQSLNRDFTPEKLGTRDVSMGLSSSGRDVTLHTKKPSVAGKEDVLEPNLATSDPALVRNPASSDPSLEGARIGDRPGLQEPGIYRLDAVPEAEKRSDMNEPLNANYGRRWIGLQQKLREGRDQVVSDCPLCGSQKKVA